MKAKRAVVIGAGGREHALAHALALGGAEVYATPGNGGIGAEAHIFPANSPEAVVRYFGRARPLVVIGPEAPLAQGWSDVLRAANFPVVGPSLEASRLESSKAFAKAVMHEAGVPTATARTAFSAEELGRWITAESRWPKVMKQSGLAQGKGVVVAPDRATARRALAWWQAQPQVWQDGVLWEDYLEGYELSAMVVTNGEKYRWLPVAQDYKRLTSAPDSPNTGGMGAVAPIPVDPALMARIDREVFEPMMNYLTSHRFWYRGILYAGLMVTPSGPIVLEFNVRLGDPETQAIVPILGIDWYDFWMDVAQGSVPDIPEPTQSAVAVVMAAAGYPDHPENGMALRVGAEMDNTVVYHAGTRVADGGLESQGGRVLTVVGLGDDIGQARERAYARIRTVEFPNGCFRPDIGESSWR